MTATRSKDLGNRGEALARQYLEGLGYAILETGYRSGHLEIDLIARTRNLVVFVEVKTRIKSPDSQAENPLDGWQIRNLKRAMSDYCFKNRISLDAVRLDLIHIITDPITRSAQLKHYKDLF